MSSWLIRPYEKADHDACRALWEQLTEGYVLEALRSREKEAVGSTSVVESFVGSLASGIATSDPEVGLGSALDVTADRLAGGGLSYEGELCHLSAFCE